MPHPEVVALDINALARAYVGLDRIAYFELQKDLRFERHCQSVRDQIDNSAGATTHLKSLCTAGADPSEILWILSGCNGLPGFTHTKQVFGWPAEELSECLETIETAASVMEKVQRHPFGILAAHSAEIGSGLSKRLSAYVEMARMARRDFGYRSYWFLNIAKARLVIHVICHTAGAVHDKHISGLIAAVTGTDYSPAAQLRWRQKYADLIGFRGLDPITAMTAEERKLKVESWQGIAAADPEFHSGYESWVEDFGEIAASRRGPSPRPRRPKK